MIFTEEQTEKEFISKPLDIGLVNSLLLVVKETILNTSISGVFKETLATHLESYIDKKLLLSNIQYENKHDLLLFLSEHLESVQNIITACKDARAKFGNSLKFLLSLDKERDQSGFCAVVLYICLTEYSEEQNNVIEIFGLPYTRESLELSGVLFSITPEYLI